MGKQIVRVARISAIGAVLLGGLVYSVLALAPTPAYASSCDCVEALQDANEICANNNLGAVDINNFYCPYPTDDIFYFTCTGGGTPFYELCSF